MFSDTSGFDAQLAAKRLDEFGIVLSADGQKWLDRMLELRANPPQEAHPNAVAVLIADGAKPADIAKAVAAHNDYPHLAQQTKIAQNLLGQRVLDSIVADKQRIHAELRQHADEAIDRLNRAARLDGNITDLTRARRAEDAHLLATAESDCETLHALYRVRDQYLEPGSPQSWSTGRYSCSQIRNPQAVEFVADHDGSRWGLMRARIRAGAEFWFPTRAEARAESSRHEPKGNVLPSIDPRRTGAATFTG